MKEKTLVEVVRIAYDAAIEGAKQCNDVVYRENCVTIAAALIRAYPGDLRDMAINNLNSRGNPEKK